MRASDAAKMLDMSTGAAQVPIQAVDLPCRSILGRWHGLLVYSENRSRGGIIYSQRRRRDSYSDAYPLAISSALTEPAVCLTGSHPSNVILDDAFIEDTPPLVHKSSS